jgi:16S rRNA (adenine1518-N6/adenine1519-N6)-dimethyltransferase
VNENRFRAKKSLGQNFLADENIARKIVAALSPQSDDVILEIGAGFGVLTKYLLAAAKKVIAVEIDGQLAAKLSNRFAGDAGFELLHADFLEVGFMRFATVHKRLKIIGNIPYHITSPVIFKAFEYREFVTEMVLMLQREVAERIVAPPGSKVYGILSVYSQLYSQPALLFRVSRQVFRPKPDVDSAIIHWDFSKSEESGHQQNEILDQIVHLAFQQRRKMLRKSLQQLSGFSQIADNLQFDLTKRPEQLAAADFISLSKEIAALWMKQV